jgi:hypothetical protein
MVPSSTACPSPPPLLSPSLSFSSALRFYHQLSATAINGNTPTAQQGDRATSRPANRSANFYSSHMIQSTTPQLPHLVKLKLNECFITDEGIKFLLPYLRSLTTLKLSSTFITSASGQALSSFRSLVTLEVNGCHGALLSNSPLSFPSRIDSPSSNVTHDRTVLADVVEEHAGSQLTIHLPLQYHTHQVSRVRSPQTVDCALVH